LAGVYVVSFEVKLKIDLIKGKIKKEPHVPVQKASIRTIVMFTYSVKSIKNPMGKYKNKVKPRNALILKLLLFIYFL